MNIIKELDRLYKEWSGDHHTTNSNLKVHDSSDAQDFARYCIDELGLVSGLKQKTFKQWYKDKYDPKGYLYPSAPLNIGFQDYCERVEQYLRYLANEQVLPLATSLSHDVSGSTLHPVGKLPEGSEEDVCHLCIYKHRCSDEEGVYERCLDELKQGEYYR